VYWSLGNVLVRRFLKTEPIKVEVVTLQKPIAGLPVILLLVGFSTWNPKFFFGKSAGSSVLYIIPGIIALCLGK